LLWVGARSRAALDEVDAIVRQAGEGWEDKESAE
jgi:hypothetical protein